MNKNTKITIFSSLMGLLFLVYTTSCSNDNTELYGNFTKEYTLLGDSVSKQAQTYENYFIHLVDGNVILPSPKNRADTLLHIYSTPDLKLKIATGVLGHSKYEFQDNPCICNSSTGSLYIKGYTHNTLRKVEVTDSALLDLEHLKLFTQCAPNNMHMIGDSMLYYLNISKKKIISFNVNRQTNVNEFDIQNLYGSKGQPLIGTLCVNNHLAIYAMQYKREIVVLRTEDLSYVKTIKREYENQDKEIESGAKDCTFYYTGGFASEDKFYLLYIGIKNGSSYKESNIEVYDKDMNPVCIYHLHPVLYSFAVDEKNGYIYGLGNNTDYIYRFKLTK